MKSGGFKRPEYVRKPAPAPRPIRQVAPTIIAAPAPDPKSPRYADRHLLDMARGKPCLLQSPICCHNPETTVACHAGGVSNGKGMGYKTSDALSVWGCYQCNHYTDAYGGATRAEKEAVFAAGHARQIIAWREIEASPTAPGKDRRSARYALELLGLS